MMLHPSKDLTLSQGAHTRARARAHTHTHRSHLSDDDGVEHVCHEHVAVLHARHLALAALVGLDAQAVEAAKHVHVVHLHVRDAAQRALLTQAADAAGTNEPRNRGGD